MCFSKFLFDAYQKTPEIRRFQVFFVEIEGAPRLYGKRKRDNLSRFLDDRAFLTAVFDIRKRQTWDRVDRYERIVVERIEAFHHY